MSLDGGAERSSRDRYVNVQDIDLGAQGFFYVIQSRRCD